MRQSRLNGLNAVRKCCLFKRASQFISYLTAAKALLPLLVFNFTVERLFEDGALSIKYNRILIVFFERAPRCLLIFYFKLGRLFEGGALSIACNKIFRFSKERRGAYL